MILVAAARVGGVCQMLSRTSAAASAARSVWDVRRVPMLNLLGDVTPLSKSTFKKCCLLALDIKQVCVRQGEAAAVIALWERFRQCGFSKVKVEVW
jgi:hypothetical protein